MKSIGIKLADGSFYPIMEDGKPCNKTLSLTTVKDNQTTVKVDLYQSETGTMEGAKYLDTLEIENLNPHPNGEPDFNLTVELDENNNLSAKVNDPETNKESSKAVNLIKRAAEELSDSAIAAAKQLAESFRSFDNPKSEGAEATVNKDIDIPEENLEEETPIEETPIEETPIEETPIEETPIEETPIEETPIEETPIKETPIEETPIEETPIEETPIEEAITDSDSTEFLDDNTTEIIPDDNTIEAPDTFDTSELDALNDETFNIDDTLNDGDTLANDAIIENPEVLDDNDNTTTNVTDNIVADDGNTFTDEVPVDNDKFNLPDLDNLDATDSSTGFSTNEISDDSINEFNDISDNSNTDSLSLADLDIDDLDANGNSPAENSESQTMFNEDEFSVPDFDDPQVQTQSLNLKDGTFDDPIFNLPEDQNNSLDLSDFDDGDFATTTEQKNNNAKNNYNVYSNNYTEKKSNNVAVIVCVICAIICLLATAFVFFIIPRLDLSKILKTTDNTKEKIEEKDIFSDDIFNNINNNQTDDSPIQITIEEPKAPAAEENKIVVSPIPEVIPEKPVKQDDIITQNETTSEKENTNEKIEGIRYRIKWGDTLWDLSDTYYRNPWLYPRIAKYNNIKDPDYIISGTFITIPK